MVNESCDGAHQEYRSCARRTPCLEGNGSDYDGTEARFPIAALERIDMAHRAMSHSFFTRATI